MPPCQSAMRTPSCMRSPAGSFCGPGPGTFDCAGTSSWSANMPSAYRRSPALTRRVSEARYRPAPPLSRQPPSARVGSTSTPTASARAASTAADRVVVPVVAGCRRRPAFFNAAPSGLREAVCPPRSRSPPRSARARAPTRSASPGDTTLPSRAGDPLAAVRPARPRIRRFWRLTVRSWHKGGVAFGRGYAQYLCRYRDLRPSLFSWSGGLWDGCPFLRTPLYSEQGLLFRLSFSKVIVLLRRHRPWPTPPRLSRHLNRGVPLQSQPLRAFQSSWSSR